jgi:cation transport regulator ChaC
VEHRVFEHLDHREKNGYQQFPVEIYLNNAGKHVDGLLYVADHNNPAFLGPAPMQQLADQIAASHGPSGSNRDYVMQLAEALRELGDDDPHVRELESLLSAATET